MLTPIPDPPPAVQDCAPCQTNQYVLSRNRILNRWTYQTHGGQNELCDVKLQATTEALIQVLHIEGRSLGPLLAAWRACLTGLSEAWGGASDRLFLPPAGSSASSCWLRALCVCSRSSPAHAPLIFCRSAQQLASLYPAPGRTHGCNLDNAYGNFNQFHGVVVGQLSVDTSVCGFCTPDGPLQELVRS